MLSHPSFLCNEQLASILGASDTRVSDNSYPNIPAVLATIVASGVVADKFVGGKIPVELTILTKKILMERIPVDKILITCQNLLRLSEKATSLAAFRYST